MSLHDVTVHGVALHETLGLGAPIADKAEYWRALRAVDEMVDDPSVNATRYGRRRKSASALHSPPCSLALSTR